MSGSNHYEVIVVGAGPAGGVAAYALARVGCRTLLLEKEKLPRYKACGGALVRRALDALPFSIQNDRQVLEGCISRIRLTINHGSPFVADREQPVIVMTMRSAFDEMIARKAVQTGAILKDQVTVGGVVESCDSVRCETSAGSFTAQY